MKKFISIVIAMLMALSIVPAAMASETDTTDTAERFMLTYQNFELPDTSWAVDEGKLLGTDYKSINPQGKDASKRATARIYAEKAGTYSVWVLWKNGQKGENRVPAVYVNEAKIEKDGSWSDVQNTAWEKVNTVSLNKGWNTVSVGMVEQYKPYFLNGMYITSDTTEEVTANQNNTLLAKYGDITAPVIASNAAVTTEQSVGQFQVTFPQATDANTLHYSYTVDGTEKEIDDITKPVDFSSYSGEKSVTLTAADAWGNKAEKTFTVSVPELYTRILLNRTNFEGATLKESDGNSASLYAKLGFKVNSVSSQPNVEPTATFYVDEPGDYNIWIHSFSKDSSSDGNVSRIPIAKIDGKDEGKLEYSYKGEINWEAKKCTLTKGWHTLQFVLKANWKAYSIYAVYITNDLTETVTKDNANTLKTYLSGGVGINGAVYDAKGLAKAGVESDCGYINLTPIKPLEAGESATVTVNSTSETWDTAFKVDLNSLENTVTIDTSDDSGDAEFAVINLGTEYTTTAASLSGQTESAFPGADGKRKAYSLTAEGSATWSISGVSGKRDVWVYQIGAGEGACANSAAEIKASGATDTKTFDNSGSTSGWVKLGTYTFSGTGEESVTVKGSTAGTVYVDSIKLTYADELIPVSSKAVEKDGNVAFEYKYYNRTDTSKSVTIAAAAYSGDALADVTLNQESAVRGMNVFQTKALTGGTEYKGFVFDSVSTLVPLAAPVTYSAN